jgi:hypothetical protein
MVLSHPVVQTIIAKTSTTVAPVLSNVLAIRGGSMIEKDMFIKIVQVSFALFGLQMFAVPKMFWEMNFKAPAFESPNNSLEFLMRMCGLSILTLCGLAQKVDTEWGYKVLAASVALVTYFGPYTAEKNFETLPAHKLPVILMPTLLVLAALAY